MEIILLVWNKVKNKRHTDRRSDSILDEFQSFTHRISKNVKTYGYHHKFLINDLLLFVFIDPPVNIYM